MEPEDAEAYLQRASVYAMQVQYDKAIADLNRVIQIQPQNAQALKMRADLLEQTGRPRRHRPSDG